MKPDIKEWILRNAPWWRICTRWFGVTFKLKKPVLLNANFSCLLCNKTAKMLLYRRIATPLGFVRLGLCAHCIDRMDKFSYVESGLMCLRPADVYRRVAR